MTAAEKKPRGKQIRIVKISFVGYDQLTAEERARVDGAKRRLDAGMVDLIGHLLERGATTPEAAN